MLEVFLSVKVKMPVTLGALIKKTAAITAKMEKKVKGQVEITVIGGALMRKLNAKYRGKNSVTDVLSFGWQEDKTVKSAMLGEIYICWSQIWRQARRFGVSNSNELARMTTHGLLHLAGYDHLVPNQARKMFTLQEKIVAQID